MRIVIVSVVVVLIFVSFGCFAQERKLNYGVHYYGNLSSAHPDDLNVYSDYFRGFETFVYSHSFGIDLDWNYSEKWLMSVSASYGRVGEKTKIIDAQPEITYMYDEQFIFEFQYFEFAINLNRKFGKYLFAEFGLSPVKTIRSKVELYQPLTNSWSAMQDKDIFEFNFFGNLGFGFNYSFKPFKLKILPYTQLQLLNVHDPYIFGRHFPYMQYLSIGIKTSVLF